MQQSQSSNGAPADLAAAVAAAAATVATVRKNAQRKASTAAGMAGKQPAWAQASVGQHDDLKAVPDQGSLGHRGSLKHRVSFGRLVLQLPGTVVVLLLLLLFYMVKAGKILVKAGKILVTGVVDKLQRKVEDVYLRVLNLTDLQPEEVDSLTPEEIKKCIQYSAWADAAYDENTADARTTLEFEKYLGVLQRLKPPAFPLPDVESLEILSGSSELAIGRKGFVFKGLRSDSQLAIGRKGFVFKGLRSDSQALVGLLDSNEGGLELVVAFRGTEPLNALDWLTDLFIGMDDAFKLVAKHEVTEPRVHSGFTTSVNDFLTPQDDLFHGNEQMTTDDRITHKIALEKQGKKKLSHAEDVELKRPTVKTLQELVDKMAKAKAEAEARAKGEDVAKATPKKITKVVFCGHSLGGALATLAAYWCKNTPDTWAGSGAVVECYTYGAPRVGNEAFTKLWNETVLKQNPGRVFRIMHHNDPVPGVPFSTLPLPLPGDLWEIPYYHVGGGVVLCQPGVDPMVGRDGNPKMWPELNKKHGYQAQKRHRPISLDHINIVDHIMPTGYQAGLIDALHSLPHKE